MRQKEYRFVFFLNIRHSFYSETELGKKHSHTWELEITMHPRTNTIVRFRDVELVVLSYLEGYQDKYLNAIPPFHHINPSIENFLDAIIAGLKDIMDENDWELLRVTIAENPTRSYMIDFRDEDSAPVSETEIPGEMSAEENAGEKHVATDSAPERESEPVKRQVFPAADDIAVSTKKTDNMTRIVIRI